MANNELINASSVLETGEQPGEKIRKRRSSIFQSRTLALDECGGADTSLEKIAKADQLQPEDQQGESQPVKDPATENIIPETDSEFDLAQYIESLRQERTLWMKKLKERKVARKVISKERAHINLETASLDTNVLSQKERTFLAVRPDYEYLAKECKELSGRASLIANWNQLASRLSGEFISLMEQGVYNSKKRAVSIVDSS